MSARRPRIAMVTDAIAPYHRGGKEQRYIQLSRRIGRRADVHVYTMKWWPGPRVIHEDGVTLHAICPRLAIYNGERRSTLEAVMFAIGCLRLLGARMDVIEADHMPYLQLFPLKLVALLRRKRLVVTWHEVWSENQWREYLGPAGRLAWKLERLAARLPDRIVATSEQTAARLRELRIGTPVTVAPGGVDLDAVRALPRAEAAPEVISVGRLLAHKRHDLLLDAIALLAPEHRPTCAIVGNGPEREALREQADRLGIGDQVEVMSEISSDVDLLSMLKAARLCVFASEREGFGIAALEAIACGVPVLTTTAPHNLARHLVARADRGIVCEPVPEALAAEIAATLERSAEPADGSGDAWLNEFDWGHVATLTYDALLPGEASRNGNGTHAETTR